MSASTSNTTWARVVGATATTFGQYLRGWFDVLRWVAAAVILILGLHFLGVFKIGFLMREARMESKRDPSTILGAYVMGLAFGGTGGVAMGRDLRQGLFGAHSTVTDLARLRGWSTSVPLATAV